MRQSNPRPRRRAEVGALTWIALAVLQPLTGILSDLAVALLPDGWAQQRAILILTMLLIAIALVASLQAIVFRFSSPSPISTPPAAQRRQVNGVDGAAFPNGPAERSVPLRSEGPSGRAASVTWREAVRSTLEGAGEVLLLLGLAVRWAVWRISRPSEHDISKDDGAESSPLHVGVGGMNGHDGISIPGTSGSDWSQPLCCSISRRAQARPARR